MNTTGASVCDACPPRYYCTNQDRADPCPQGAYCPGSNGLDYSLCPAGTYNPSTMLQNMSECVPCDGGKYCETPGLGAPTGNCSAGYYCASGVDLAAPEGNNTGDGGTSEDFYTLISCETTLFFMNLRKEAFVA